MAEKMTRAEQRGILQQLVKQQQATLGLAEAIAVDAELEAGIAALRAEHNSLVTTIKTDKVEAADAATAVDSLDERLRQLRGAIRLNEAKLEQLQRDVDAAQRKADADIKQHAKRADDSRQVQLADVQRTAVARQQAADTEHAERVLAMRKELEALQERKETIAGEIAGMLDRFGTR